MSETSPRPIDSASPPALHLVEGSSTAPAADSPQATSWAILFGSLACAGGHGLFLFFALTQLQRIPNVAELGGAPNALVVGWLVASFPLAMLSFFGRQKLMAMPASRLRTIAFVTLAVTLAVFALYVRKMVIA